MNQTSGRFIKFSYKIEMVKLKKLFVGGIPWESTEDTLRAYFQGAGTVETSTIITDRLNGRSKGYGFIEMSTLEEAERAIEMFNGKEFEGRQLTVNEAQPPRPREEREPRRDF